MTDLSFITGVAATLLSYHWTGRRRLSHLVGAQLTPDPVGSAQLTGVLAGGRPDLVLQLAATIRRHAERDPRFGAALRRLVVEAYAEPGTSRRLPDPSPEVD